MAAPEPFIQFEVPEAGNDRLVHAILHAHVQHESIRSLRLSWVHVLATLGGLMALTTVVPASAPAWVTANLALAWGLCCVGAVGSAIREHVWRRRRDLLLSETKLSIDA